MSAFDSLIRMIELRLKRQRESVATSEAELAAAIAARNAEQASSAQTSIPGVESRKR